MQTAGTPALWASNVSGNSYPGGSLELDFYAGYNGKIGDDIGWTAGGLGYYYPGGNFNKINATSALAGPIVNQKLTTTSNYNSGLSWKWIPMPTTYRLRHYRLFRRQHQAPLHQRHQRHPVLRRIVNYPLMDDLTLGFHVGRTA